MQQFKHNLSLAASSRSEKQRREALAFLTGRLSAGSGASPVGTHTLLAKLLPLASDISAPVRAQLLKLFRTLPEAEVRLSVGSAMLYLRAGMTHLSSDISGDSLNLLDWLLDVAEDELVACPGGWVKMLNTFCALLGWIKTSSAPGWTSGARPGPKVKDGSTTLARQLSVLSRFLRAGLKEESAVAASPTEYWQALYRLPRVPNPFDYLDLTGARSDGDAEAYADRQARQKVFSQRFLDSVTNGLEAARKEGGATGRAAQALDQVLKDGMRGFTPTAAVDAQSLTDLW